jgi:YVTN family beta-propeller protein
LTSALWITGFFLAAPAPYGAQAEQPNPAKATTFGYVANGFNNTISVIATNNNTVVATIPVGDGPSGVAITSDGIHAYVTNQLDNTVSVIETANNAVVATIPVGIDPSGVAITPDGSHAYVANLRGNDETNQFDRTVSVIDTASNKVVATIPVGNAPVAVAFATVTPVAL